jgi:pimeloyl-ACP methyl ester carboxylesterase
MYDVIVVGAGSSGATFPVLILRGATSDMLPAEVAAEMARKPSVRLLEIADAGHAPALMAADQISAIRDFLNAP